MSNIAPVGTKEQAKEMVLFGGKDRNFRLKRKKQRKLFKKICLNKVLLIFLRLI
jgi:hypothetical protein